MVTWRLAAVLAAGALLPALLPDPWLVAAAVVGVVLVVGLWDAGSAAPLTGVRLSRAGDTTVWLGQSALTTLTVTNTSSRPMRLRLRDRWVPSAGAARPEHRLDLPPGTSVSLDTALTPTRHGDRAAVRVTFRSYGRWGVAFRQRREKWYDDVTPPWTLRVLPRFPARRLLPEKLARLRVFDGSVVTRGRGQGTEFDNLREYVIGDDVRSIDWRATARAHDVMVRTWRPERDRRVVCVLDTGRTSAARIGDEPRLDAAIDAALLLSVLATRADDHVDLLALNSAVRARVSGGPSRTRLTRLIGAMAPLEPEVAETDFGLAAAELLRRGTRRSLVVFFTALDAAPLVEGLLPLLPPLAARHRVVIAGVQDPELTRLATLPPAGTTREAAHLAAAAEKTLAERDRIAAVLTRLGAIVVDEPRETFASKVADTYLTLKAAGRL